MKFKRLFLGPFFAMAFAFLASEGSAFASETSVAQDHSLAAPKDQIENQIPLSFGKAESDESLIPVEFIKPDDDIPARTLFLKLKQVGNSSQYEVQIRPANMGWVEPFKVKTSREKVRIRVTPGRYSIRTRSFDNKKMPGRWLEWKDFFVPFKTPIGVYPKDGSEISPKGTLSERLTLEWPKVPAAKGYRVKLYDQNGVLFKHVITTQNWFAVTLDINRAYSWSLKPLAHPKEPDLKGDAPKFTFKILEPQKDLVPVKLRISERPRTLKYQFELIQMISEDETSEPTIFESFEPVFKSRLAPAEYELRVRSLYDNDTVSSWGVPTRFWVRIPAPTPITPTTGTVIDPVDDLDNPVVLSWQKSKMAEKYKILIYDGQNQLVHTGWSKGDSYAVQLKDNEKYSWRVEAYLPREQERAPSSVGESSSTSMTNSSTFNIDKYIKLSLSPAEEPSQFFAWARTIMSNTNYLAENYDNNNRVSQPVFASTYELAAGYWHRKSRYGVLLLGGVSGIRTSSSSLFYNHGGLLLGYRGVEEEGTSRWRVWFGPAYKETPEIRVDGATRKLGITKITNSGPQFLAAYLDVINPTWGYQVYLGAYYGMNGIQTPNGLGQNNYLSYSASAYLTYRFNRESTGLFGYTYQVDEAGYATTDEVVRKDNHVLFNGHYLSFSYIWSLEPSQK